VLGLQDRQLQASLPRPSFSELPFCQTCHQSADDPIVGLRPAALEPGTVPTRDDPRRQPMAWPRHMFGHKPPLAPFSSMTTTFLDDAFLGASSTTAPRRFEPVP
jgi:hypothetical protein